VTEWSGYDLPLPGEETPGASAAKRDAALADPLLTRNALWFCHIRWIVVTGLIALGVVVWIAGRREFFGLSFRSDWPLAVGAGLAAANVAFLLHARSMSRQRSPRYLLANLWSQIVIDLLAVAVVVHYLGAMETNACFLYLFHIVLACIFLPSRQSLGVTALACTLFALGIGLEAAGILPPTSVYTLAGDPVQFDRTSWPAVFNAVSAMAVWVLVWVVASHLATAVRRRESQIEETNRRLVQAQKERTNHLLRTTHELKAPFAAIHANAQLLFKGYCGELPPEANEVLYRISVRCKRLSHEIQEMLQLANLRSEAEAPEQPEEFDVVEVTRRMIVQIRPLAEERNVTIEERLNPGRVLFVREHLRMMLANILSNAVTYSHEGDCVRVESGGLADGGAFITVEDRGIGIPADKLSRIFDEYYRTDQAQQYNQASTGLGLAIVSHIARRDRVRVRVESAPGEGTKFILRLLPPADRKRKERELQKGVWRWPTW
jgi:signal transduction histidine kinase